MLTHEENDLLTQTGPGTPGGDLLRRYWQPVALSEELPEGGAPIAIKVLGEDLTVFRDERGRIGILGIHCSHRAADLSYGRIEDGGLRCLYHGWLYDVTGQCLEQPGEPEGSSFKEKVRQLAYPAQENAGIVFGYLGPGAAPLLPDYPFLRGPEENSYACKYFHDSNYLQGNEGNIDPSHLSYLHKYVSDERSAEAETQRALSGSNASSMVLSGRDRAPTIEVEETAFGMRIFSVRESDDDERYVRISNFIYPNSFVVPTAAGAVDGGWHVPIDDTHHWKFQVMHSPTPIDKERSDQDRLSFLTPDFHHIRNRDNRYLQDRDEMRTRSLIGMGPVFQSHDYWATTGEGPIQDRTTEHLGYTDKPIALARRLLLKAIREVQEGAEAPNVAFDAAANAYDELVAMQKVVPASVEWRDLWREQLPV
jgi:phenylpropionate dioxygenase-like ring-hydroxylating dioxygenase large terminal subunit